MSFSATMVWQVQSDGSDSLNGGGFDPVSGVPGTDYSVQAAAQVTYTDLVIDGTTNTKVTSAATPFTSAHVGNILNVISGSGFTAQRVQIMSVAAAAATCDKSLGTLSSTGGGGYLGGALASPGQAGALKVANNKVFLKNSGGGTPTVYLMSNTSNVAGGRVTDSTGGTNVAPGCWVGYETTRTATNTDSNRPICKANANSVVCFSISGSHTVVRNVDVGNNGAFTGTTGISLSGNFELVERSRATSCNTGFLGSAATSKFAAIDALTCGSAISLGSSQVVGFSARGSTATGLTMGGSAVAVDGLVVGGSATGVVVGGNGGTLANITSALNTGGSSDGFTLSTAISSNVLVNCLAYGNGRSNYNDQQSGNAVTHRLIRCAGGAGGSADTTTAAQLDGFLTLSADPFANSAGGDYRPNTTAGGGALLRGAGAPQAYLGYPSVVNAPDVGAYQHADPAGGAIGGGQLSGGLQ